MLARRQQLIFKELKRKAESLKNHASMMIERILYSIYILLISLSLCYSFTISSLNKPMLKTSSNSRILNKINNKIHQSNTKLMMASYLDELTLFKGASEKKCLVGFSTDSWNIGQRKFKDFLAVHKMYKRIQKANIACIEIPMWEVNTGPHYDDLQRLFETFWIPDMTSEEQLLLQFDLTIIPDPVLAKYMIEAFYEKESKIEKKKAYYNKLIKQPWGVVDNFPPKERYEWEKIKALTNRKSMRKFPPLAACGEDAYARLKNHAQMEYYSQGVDDFALYIPDKIIPSKRVLLLRYKNRFDTLVQSLVMRGVNVTSAYPVTWMRKEWSPQEERMAKEVDVLYLHENHAVLEWRDRLGTKDVVAACHDEGVAKLAKSVGFKDVFYAKKSDTDGLTKTVFKAVEFAKSMERVASQK